MGENSRQTEGRWEDALRTAQEELDTLREKHARERQRLEQHFQSTNTPEALGTEQTTAEAADGDKLLAIGTEEEEEAPRAEADLTDLRAPASDSAADVLRLHEQLLKANEKLSRQNEEVSHRQAHPVVAQPTKRLSIR